MEIHERPPPVASEDEIAQLFRDNYGALVRLVWLLLGDLAASEEVVQDAFLKLHIGWDRIRDPNMAPAWLRSAVLNGARSRIRRLQVSRRQPGTSDRQVDSAEVRMLAGAERRLMIEQLRRLPARQREALVLKFYLDLSEAETATAMGISTGSVKTHVHRGLARLQEVMQK